MDRQLITEKFQELLTLLGLTGPLFEATPQRMATLYLEELLVGLNPAAFPKPTLQTDHVPGQRVVMREIPFVSLCAHHLLPMEGTAEVSYVPQKSSFGFAYLPRLVQYLAAKPTLQELLTEEIVQTIRQLLQIEEVSCRLSARHGCMTARFPGRGAPLVETSSGNTSYAAEPAGQHT